jgi:hypothetical protein
MKHQFLLLTTSLFILACQPGKDGPTIIPPPGGQSTSEISHLGSWTTGCITSSDNSSKIIHNLVISGNPKTVSLVVKVYPLNSSDCSSGQLAEFESQASYTRTGDDYDTVLTSYGYTPKSSQIVNSVNFSGFCGFNDWQLNVKKNILDRNCILQSVNYSRSNGELNDFTVTRDGSKLETNEYPNYEYSLLP